MRGTLTIAAFCIFTGMACRRDTAAADHAKLDALESQILDPKGGYRASVARDELSHIATDLARTEPSSRNLARVRYLQMVVAWRTEQHAEAVAFGRESVAIQQQRPELELPEDRLTLAAARVAEEAELAGDADATVVHCRIAIPRVDASKAFTEDQRLGLREKLGWALHELGRFDEARAVNGEVLARGEASFGKDDPKLLVVLENLGQNAYALHDQEGARRMLERGLAICEKAGTSTDRQKLDLLDDLGTLAALEGRRDAALERLGQARDLAVRLKQGTLAQRLDADLAHLRAGETPTSKPFRGYAP